MKALSYRQGISSPIKNPLANIASWQETMREGMKNASKKGGRLPGIKVKIEGIIRDHSPQIYSPIPAMKESLETDMRVYFGDFLKRIKKYTGKELLEQEARDLYESFLINHEEIRLLMKSNSLGKDKDWGRIAQLWESAFISNYFLNDDFLAQELKIPETEVKELFTQSLKLRFAVSNISDPLKALKQVKKHLDETLSDSNIAQELKIPETEVKELFTQSLKLYFAVSNISDPLKALKQVKKHLDETLSDSNIAQELKIPETEVKELFTQSLKLHFAVKNISDPLKALKQVKKHLDETLSDSNIAQELKIPETEVKELFTQSLKLYFAVSNISDPLKALKQVKKHLDETLSDSNIAQELKIPETEVKELFTQSLKLHFAVKNISDPLKALKQVKKHLDETLSDSNIAQELKIPETEVKELFTQSLKLHFAVSNISDPLKALKQVKKHLDETLSDSNIAQELKIPETEVKELFTQSLKLHFAVNNISDPLEGIIKWKNGYIKISGRKYPT